MACPPSYDIHMLSMDSPTGAQVGEFDLYDYKVCCKRTDVYQPRCDNGIVDDNEDCDRGLNCIMEGDNTCICPFGYNPYFPPDIQIPNDPLLNGCKATAGEMVFWSDDEDGAVSILEKNIVVGETMIYLIIQDITISDDTPMEFEIYERDLYSSQEIRTGSDALTITFSNYRAIVPWIITVQDIENAGQLLEGEVFEFYFTVNGIESGDLISTIIEAPPCDTKERCMDYTSQTECENDLCQVASNSMESIDCANPDIDCSCYWANNVCSPTWESEDIGKCWYTETTDDTCADMFLTYIWDAFWVNATPYLGDPQGLEALCVDGESTVPCPAQIKLSFFNHYNAVAAIVLIALIYFLMGLNKKKSKKKKKRK